jgi:hypothetical protein
MFHYRELSELTKPAHQGETGGDWMDFPPSSGPDPWTALLREANRLPADTKRMRGVVVTSVAIALRGLLVTTVAVAIVAFLLLTNSHI